MLKSHWYYQARNTILEKLERFLIGKVLLQILRKPFARRIHIISATRLNAQNFWEKSALGQSMYAYQKHPKISFHIYFENTTGLSEIYNNHIIYKNRHDILLFIHDDVWMDSEKWIENVAAGLAVFDIIGVAGNRRLSPSQPAWTFRALDANGFHWDTNHLSGAVAHGKCANGAVMQYGIFPARCLALDGVLIAARCRDLLRANVHFDPQFSFDFYDLDFCRHAATRGLRMGTWGIPITHQSGGNFGTARWHESYQRYLKKWNTA